MQRQEYISIIQMADGNGTNLMTYLNKDKSRSAAATGAIVEPDGSVDNTSIKRLKARQQPGQCLKVVQYYIQ